MIGMRQASDRFHAVSATRFSIQRRLHKYPSFASVTTLEIVGRPLNLKAASAVNTERAPAARGDRRPGLRVDSGGLALAAFERLAMMDLCPQDF